MKSQYYKDYRNQTHFLSELLRTIKRCFEISG